MTCSVLPEMHELVAVYEFGPGDTEEVVLYEGAEGTVHQIAVELEREAWLAGMPYQGERVNARPTQCVLVERMKPSGR